ncbi:hypothetical protein GOP47_0017808 [Adiantum capillus-veneris]|uniref:Uncharacterized protein n=1 Tax=Adiantum capillus-veneris TaxID=13818 RepID=A0A9D4UG55_ADICA|nr:hypothetical protein GOP47_0017808 [Adiantum capillus-veneris]
MRKVALICILLALCLSTVAMARRQLSPAAPLLSAAVSKHELLPATKNAGVVIPLYKRSSTTKTRRFAAAKSQHAKKEAMVYQSDYAAARTHPPTEPP